MQYIDNIDCNRNYSSLLKKNIESSFAAVGFSRLGDVMPSVFILPACLFSVIHEFCFCDQLGVMQKTTYFKAWLQLVSNTFLFLNITFAKVLNAFWHNVKINQLVS